MRQRNFARKIKFLKKGGYANGPIRPHFYWKNLKKIFF